jgi:hypothetical protein
MPDESKSAHHGRLHILTNDEIQNIFYLPTFTDEERFSYFSLTQSEFEILDQLRSLPSKLNFILQLGYFKERRQFFNFEFADVSADVEFICRKYFPQDQIEIQNLPKIAVNTILKHRRTIAALHQFRFCRSARERKAIEQTARNAARISAKPIYIFREILAFLENQRIILPGYSFLQDTISMALNYEEQRLQILLQQKLTILETKQLDELLSDSGGLYEITNLKREARDFSLGEIRREIERGIKIRELYQAAKEILPLLEISNQSIAHYASLVAYYRVDKLKRFDTWRTYLYLLCFIHQRYGRLHDILINCLLYRVRQYTDQAKLFAIEKLSSINLTTNQTLVKAAACLRVLTDEEIPPETPFGIVRQRAFKILDKDAINQFTDHILQDNQFDEPEFRWELVEKIAAQFKLNLRPLLINVEFSGVAETSELLKAIDFLRNVFRREQSLSAVNPKRFPVGFIPESQFRYFYENDKTSGKKRIRSRRYEFFVYQSLANALSAGDINCRDSLKFRSFEDDLIDDETWRQKNSLIRQANLPILSEPVEFILEELEIRLEERLREVNRRIADRENESFHRPTLIRIRYSIRSRRSIFIRSFVLPLGRRILSGLFRIYAANTSNKKPT